MCDAARGEAKPDALDLACEDYVPGGVVHSTSLLAIGDCRERILSGKLSVVMVTVRIFPCKWASDLFVMSGLCCYCCWRIWAGLIEHGFGENSISQRYCERAAICAGKLMWFAL